MRKVSGAKREPRSAGSLSGRSNRQASAAVAQELERRATGRAACLSCCFFSARGAAAHGAACFASLSPLSFWRRPPQALLSTHKGQVADLLKPAHISLQIAKTSEVSEALIMDAIATASGTKLHETKKAAFSAPAVDISRSAAAKEADYLPSSAKSSRSLGLKDEDEIKQAFKDVRSDNCETDWALLGFTEGDKFDTLELKNKGEGGVAALLAALDPARPNYALFRTREQIDKTSAVRFSFLRVVPTSLPPSKKANIGTLNGAIENLFKPYGQ